jgi:hypothetical protein
MAGMPLRLLRAAARAALLGLAACAREAPVPAAPAAIDLLDFHQADATGVFLNETLVLHFSRDLDRSSVTRASVAVVDDRGRPVPGELAVDGPRVAFTPLLPRSPDLTDGGFLPGSRFHVAVTGFPFPDGVRGRDGEPLRASRAFSFRTVPVPDRGDEAVFAPPLVEAPAYLGVRVAQVGPVDPIVLTTDVPLDPRTVTGDAFELLDGTEPLRLRVTLAANDASGARIDLRALGAGRGRLRALEPGAWYVLRIAEGAEPPRTLGGIPVQPAWAVSRLGGARIEVGSRLGTHRLEFDRPRIWSAPVGAGNLGPDQLWSVEPLGDVDGTATWGDGAIAIRYPAAAGTGADGAVALEAVAPERLRDVHATQLLLAPNRTVTLPADGLVVLRSQGAMRIAGALRRPPRPEAAEAPAPPMTFPAGDTLSAWLERARAENPPWTVLIAGGDLYVDRGPEDSGGVDVAGPLLLVAGGRLRISDTLRAGALWRLAPGDANELARPELAWVPSAVDWSLPPEERFRVDAPERNPLVEPLTFGVQSAGFRPPAGVAAWRPGRYHAEPGNGGVRVRWIGQRFTAHGFEEYGPVDDVLLLAGSDALRFTVELTVPAALREPYHAGDAGDAGDAEREKAGMWDPPTVEYVELRWDAPLPGAIGAPVER